MNKKTTTIEEYYDHGSLRVTQTLMIRLLEWAKTEAADDTALHKAVENMAKLDTENHYRTLNIEDYDYIVKPPVSK